MITHCCNKTIVSCPIDMNLALESVVTLAHGFSGVLLNNSITSDKLLLNFHDDCRIMTSAVGIVFCLAIT